MRRFSLNFAIGIAVLSLFTLLSFNAWNTTSLQYLSEQVPQPEVLPDWDQGDGLQRFIGLLSFPTVSSSLSASTPGDISASVLLPTKPNLLAGSAFLELHSYLESAYPEAHQALQREIVGKYSLLYKWAGRDLQKPPVLLMHHLDVAPVVPSSKIEWKYPPFQGVLADGFVWGRGSLDTKVGVAALFEAVTLLLRQGYQPLQTFYFALGHDEEAGGFQGNAQIAQKLHQQEIQLAYVLDEGYPIITPDLPGFTVPIAPIGIAEKGVMHIELQVGGTEGHTAVPSSRNALNLLSESIWRLEQHPMPLHWDGPIQQTLDYLVPEMPFWHQWILANRSWFRPLILWQFSRFPETQALVRTTSVVTTLSGGNHAMQWPIGATATIQFRLHPEDTSKDVLDHVRHSIDNSRVQIRQHGKIQSEASKTSLTNSRAFQNLQTTIHQVFPQVVVAPALLVAATDSRHYAALTDNIFRFSPWFVASDDIQRIHGINERISIQAFATAVKFYYQFIHNSSKRYSQH